MASKDAVAAFPDEPLRLSLIGETQRRELALLLERQVGCTPSSPALAFAPPRLLRTLEHCGMTAPETGPLSHARGVAKLLPLTDEVPIVPVPHVVYFVRPALAEMPALVAHALAFTSRSPKTKVSVVFVPKRSLLCEHALLDEFHLRAKVAALQIEDFDLDFVQIDEDVLSMAHDSAMSELLLDGELVTINSIARSIVKLQTARFGAIPLMRAKGHLAAKILQVVTRLQDTELGKAFVEEEVPEVEALLIVDRTIDLITPLLTQQTYEGLLQELYDIDHQQMRLPSDDGRSLLTVASPDNLFPDSRPVLTLNANDRMFAEIRDVPFHRVGPILREKSVFVKETYEKKNDKGMSLRDLQDFIANLPVVQELHRCIGLHTSVATAVGSVIGASDFRRQVAIEQSILELRDDSKVVDYIDELICKSVPLTRVARLICLYSLANDGLKSKLYEPWRDSLMATYGIPQVLTMWEALERAGLLARQQSQFVLRSSFEAKRKALRLWDPPGAGADGSSATDAPAGEGPTATARTSCGGGLTSCYNGYCPIVVRALEAMGLESGPRAALTPLQREALDLVGGEDGEAVRDLEVPGNTRITMIFFVGGVTHAELSALRGFNRQLAQRGEARRLVFATTGMTSGRKLMEQLFSFELATKTFT